MACWLPIVDKVRRTTHVLLHFSIRSFLSYKLVLAVAHIAPRIMLLDVGQYAQKLDQIALSPQNTVILFRVQL